MTADLDIWSGRKNLKNLEISEGIGRPLLKWKRLCGTSFAHHGYLHNIAIPRHQLG